MKHPFTAALLSAAFLCPTTALAQDPGGFVAKAIQGDNSEIMLGQLAEKNAGSVRVRRFGARLVIDHTRAKTQAMTIANGMSIDPPSQPTPEARSEFDKLSKMRGKSFDAEFVNYMVADHQKDVDDFTNEASARDGRASSLASRQLPTLKDHLHMAETLRKTQ